jgi:transcriptional regulator with XRE-family HTH domain
MPKPDIPLKEWREEQGVSIRELAKRARVGFITVWRIENGKLSPTVKMLRKLARALEVDVTELFEPPRKRRAVNRKARRKHGTRETRANT